MNRLFSLLFFLLYIFLMYIDHNLSLNMGNMNLMSMYADKGLTNIQFILSSED